MDWIKTTLAVINGYIIIRAILTVYQWTRDRSGNSGRTGKH